MSEQGFAHAAGLLLEARALAWYEQSGADFFWTARMRRHIARIIVYALLAAATWLVWKKWHPQNPDAIPAAGGRAMSVRLPENGPRFLQRDPKWSDDRLGDTNETLGAVGCTLCSVAMAANALGETTTPKELNQRLTERHAFTSDGWLVWGQIAGVFGGRVEAVVSGKPSYAELDRALERSDYPIVKILLWEVVPHWMIVIGKEGTEYLVRDPLEDVERPLKLSEQADMIQSVRFIRRAGPRTAPTVGTRGSHQDLMSFWISS